MTSPPNPVAPPGPIAKWEWWAIGGILLLAALLRLSAPSLAYFNLHVGRDLYRALELLHLDRIHLLGSEMQYGGRVFGPIVYILYAIPLIFSKSPVLIGIFIGVLNTCLVAWLWAFTRLRFGASAALVAALLYATFPLEVVQLRYLWNPCFLPLMVMGMYYSTVKILEGSTPWWLLGTVGFFSMAFQLHFSAVMTVPFLIAVLCRSRVRVPARVLGGAALLLLLLFSPVIIYELRGRGANSREAVSAPVARPSVWERHQPNPTAWFNLRHIVTFDWNEKPNRLGFTYLWFVRTSAERDLGGLFPLLWGLAGAATLIHGGLWLAGVWALLVTCRKASRPSSLPVSRPVAALLLCWQFAPLPFLTFFNYHQMADQLSIVPIRYYLVTFPVGFLVAGVGFASLTVMLRGAARRVLVALPAHLALVYLCIIGMHLSLLHRSGIALPYLHFHAPTLSRMLSVREHLLGTLKISVDDYYERLSAQNVFTVYSGEATLDFLITQDPRAYTNPGLPPGQHVVIHAPAFDSPLGAPPEKHRVFHTPANADGSLQREVSEAQFGLIEVSVFEGTRPDSEHFQTEGVRNYYYRHERMKYFGWRALPDVN